MSESNQQSEPRRERIIEDLPEPLARRLCYLARRWVPPIIKQRKIEKLFWGEEDLSQVATKLIVDQKGRSLRFECEVVEERSRELMSRIDSDVLRGKSFHGETNDGFVFRAEKAYWKSTKNFSLITISGYQWVVLSKDRRTNLWLGEVICKLPWMSSNLLVQTRGPRPSSSPRGLRLKGQKYTYFLVERSRGTLPGLLIDTGDDQSPDPDTLDPDLRSLEFVLGQPVQLDNLHAYDEHEGLLGHAGGDLRRIGIVPDRSESPLPVSFSDRATWEAPLFMSLSQAFGRHNSAHLKSAIMSYVDSVGNDAIEKKYIGLQLALGALARAVLEEQKRDAFDLVRNEDEWQAWVSQQTDALSLQAAPGSEEVLLLAVKRLATPDASTLVRRALAHLDLPSLPEMEEELNCREISLATGLMQPEPSEDLNKAVRRIQVLRTMIVAILSKWIEYDGMVRGWEQDRNFYYVPLDWWSVAGRVKDDADRLFRATVVDEVLDFWPVFERPKVPEKGFLATIARFADSLSDKTGRQVMATFQPVPRASHEREFEFKLMVSGDPGTQITFFMVTESDEDKIVVRGWGDKDMALENEAQVLDFLQSVAASEETREAVERMMILAEEIRRGDQE